MSALGMTVFSFMFSHFRLFGRYPQLVFDAMGREGRRREAGLDIPFVFLR